MAPINSESPVFYLYNVTAPGINSLFSRHIFPQGSNETIGMHYVISNYTSLKSTCQKFLQQYWKKTGRCIGFSQNFVIASFKCSIHVVLL